jgi:hypothetical protein
MSASLKYGAQEEVMPASRASETSEPEYDIEKNKNDVNVTSTSDTGSDEHPFAVHDNVKRQGKLWKIANTLSKYGVEQRGIERILPEERTQTSVWR